MADDFFSMTELGTLYGVSSHKVGKWLVDLGLRDANKKPSRLAFEHGLVAQRDSTQPGTYYWVWHGAKTMAVLDRAGHKRAVNKGDA